MEQYNQNPINPSPVPTPAQMPAQTPVETMPAQADKSTKKVGPIIVGLIIILVTIAAVLYIFAAKSDNQAMPNDNGSIAASQTATSQPAEVPQITNSADDPASLQADLNSSTQGLDDQNF